MDVLAVSRWSEVFETAESRRHRSLLWISVPVSFNSTGLQRLLDEFDGIKAAALYGCWNALLKVAATAPTRGVLAGQKGEAYTPGRLARLSGFPQEIFEELIPWCLQVGWLVIAQVTTGLPDLTGPNLTQPDRTGPDASPCRAVPEDSVLNRRKRSAEERQELEFDSTENRKPKTENGEATVNGPASVKLGDLARLPLLARLDAVPVTASGSQIFGSVFSPDRIKPEDIERAETAFWLSWYRDQLGSRSPVLRCGTAAEACFVLASVLAVKRVKGVKQVALLVRWIKSLECGSITETDWKKAAERIERALGIPSASSPVNATPAAAAQPSDVGSVDTAARSIQSTTKELTKRPRMTRADLARRAAELRESETAKAS